jgi:hypothetical protein
VLKPPLFKIFVLTQLVIIGITVSALLMYSKYKGINLFELKLHKTYLVSIVLEEDNVEGHRGSGR